MRDEGVLILASGSITHNLWRALGGGLHDRGGPEILESADFRLWMNERSSALDWPALFDYRRRAPFAVDMHPTDEHLLPWFAAAGAGGARPGLRLHASQTHGDLGMDAYAFGAGAAALAAAVGSGEP